MAKGDGYRPVDPKRFAENFDRIFGGKTKVVDFRKPEEPAPDAQPHRFTDGG